MFSWNASGIIKVYLSLETIHGEGMLYMKKHFANVFAAFVACASIVPSFAANISYEDDARMLHELGLYKGVNESVYEPDLESNLTREQAAVILIRLFGQQDEVDKMSNSKVKATLAKFMDVYEISDWARGYVAYATSQGYIKGFEKEDGFYFDPQGGLKGIDYASLVLQQLSISNFKYNNALDRLESEGIITKEQNKKFSKNVLTRDDVVGISRGVLDAKYDEHKTVIQNLVDTGKVEREIAEEFGLVEKIAITPTPTPVVPTLEPIATSSTVPVVTAKPTTTPSVISIVPEEDNDLRRAQGAVKVGQWTLSNSSREALNVNKIYLSAEYGGQTSILNPAYVSDYSIEDVDGNVYATFSNINGSAVSSFANIQGKREVDLARPFVINPMLGNDETEKDLVVYARIEEGASYGGTFELFLGDGTTIFEATGSKTGTAVKKLGDRIQQEDGKRIIAISKIIPEEASYNKEPTARDNVTVAAFKLANKGPKAVLMKKIKIKELYSSSNNRAYTLRNENMEVIAKANSMNGDIIFEIANGQRISAGRSENFTVQMDNKPERGTVVRLRIEQEGTCYDSVDKKGYFINIDESLLLDEVVFRD